MPEVLVEAELYTPVRRFLFAEFSKLIAEAFSETKPEVFAVDVSTIAGITDGTWMRPDLAALCLSRGQYVPFIRGELHTFEVKTATGLDVRSAHEAAAHKRLAHYAWLTFQSVGTATPQSRKFNAVLASANTLGVGVVTFKDPDSPSTWTVSAWPDRSLVNDSVADAFVRERFDEAEKRRIHRRLTSWGWPDSDRKPSSS